MSGNVRLEKLEQSSIILDGTARKRNNGTDGRSRNALKKNSTLLKTFLNILSTTRILRMRDS